MIEDVYRYSVKCNRERSRQIMRAAAVAGLSVEAFVQRHFETILDGSAAPAVVADPAPPMFDRNDHELADRLGITAGMAKLLRAMKSHADEDGVCSPGRGTLARQIGMTDASVNTFLSKLHTGGHIARLSGGGFRGAAVYRIVAKVSP